MRIFCHYLINKNLIIDKFTEIHGFDPECLAEKMSSAFVFDFSNQSLFKLRISSTCFQAVEQYFRYGY